MSRPRKTWADVRHELRTKVRPGGSTGCLLWTGPTFNHGAGRVHFDGRQHQAHRLVWYAMTGQWPDQVRQTCKNPLCISPRHLVAPRRTEREEAEPPRLVSFKDVVLVGLTGGQVAHLTAEPYRAGESRLALCGQKATTVTMPDSVLAVLPLCKVCKTKIDPQTLPYQAQA